MTGVKVGDRVRQWDSFAGPGNVPQPGPMPGTVVRISRHRRRAGRTLVVVLWDSGSTGYHDERTLAVEGF